MWDIVSYWVGHAIVLFLAALAAFAIVANIIEKRRAFRRQMYVNEIFKQNMGIFQIMDKDSYYSAIDILNEATKGQYGESIDKAAQLGYLTITYVQQDYVDKILNKC
jgi:hypothetical protein